MSNSRSVCQNNYRGIFVSSVEKDTKPGKRGYASRKTRQLYEQRKIRSEKKEINRKLNSIPIKRTLAYRFSKTNFKNSTLVVFQISRAYYLKLDVIMVFRDYLSRAKNAKRLRVNENNNDSIYCQTIKRVQRGAVISTFCLHQTNDTTV